MNDDPRQWLSTGAEALAAMPQSEGNWDCDVLIVGSGYGGAVAGAAMAGATRDDGQRARVWILERGLERAPGRFPGRFRDLAGEVRFGLQDGRAARGNAEGLFDVRIGGDMSVLLGNGLGGGSLINSGVMHRPQPEVFEVGWPASVTAESLEPFYRDAEIALGAASLPKEVTLDKLSLLDTLGLVAGQPADRCKVTVNFGPEIRVPDGLIVPKCTLCGDCLTGCNVGAKRSLDTSYLVEARRHGAKIFCGGFVERVEALKQGQETGWQVVWHLTEPTRRGGERPLRARRVVLAAGALGSTEILMRSRAAHPELIFSSTLGHGFSGNGDAIIAARGHARPVHAVDVESSHPRTTDRMVGPTITGLQRYPAVEGRPSFVLQEFAVPAPLRSVFGEITALLERVAAKGMTATGGDPFAVTDFSIERTSLFGQITEDNVEGELRLDALTKQSALEGGVRIVSPGWIKDNAAGAALAAVHFERGAIGLVTTFPDLLQRLPVCTHPLGGCRMADDAAHGVVDSFGEVFLNGTTRGTSGLAVLDASILPKALGINPALTISALAARGAQGLMTVWGLGAREKTAGGPLPSPRPFVPLLTGPRTSPTWRIRERQTGLATWPRWRGQTIALEIEFEPIKSFRRLLAGRIPPKVGVRHAELLVGNLEGRRRLPGGPGGARHVLSGAVTFFIRPPPPAHTDGVAPAAFTIDYDLTVKTVDSSSPLGLAVGTRVHGVKYFNPNQIEDLWSPDLYDGLAHMRSPWRELSEIELAIDDVPAGRLSLDLGDLVDRGEALLRAESLPSMPDALDDLGAIGLYFGRHLTRWLTNRFTAYKALHRPRGLSDPSALATSRRPGVVAGIMPDWVPLAHGAWMSVYRPSEPRASDVPPVLLIHGLAMSGNSFTHGALTNGGLAAALLAAGREVWVLDLRSSIANDAQRGNNAAADWTVEAISQDIPDALAHMAGKVEDGAPPLKVDVVAHCFGGVMFCVAALANPKMAQHIRSVVLSQVGPLIDLSPMNRLRGFLAAYLWRHGQIDEFDCVPGTGTLDPFIDAVCASFPYLDRDEECDPGHWDSFADLIRHRADMIFGQMYDSGQADDAIRQVLAELLGWVKAPLVVQALQFARQEMLTDASGRNRLLRRRNFSDGFAFPVLLIHGRDNRVFDVQGGMRSLRLLHSLRGLPDPTAAPPLTSGLATWYGKGTSAQLVILEGYGHLDVLIGKNAKTEVFPLITDFFQEADARDAGDKAARPPRPEVPDLTLDPQVEAPWIGPMLGILHEVARQDEAEGRLDVRLLIQASMRRAALETIAIVPIQERGSRLEPMFDRAVQLQPSRARRRLLSLSIDAETLRAEGIWRFAVVTVHRDLPLPSSLPGPDERQWLSERLHVSRDTLDALEQVLRGEVPPDDQRKRADWLVDRSARRRLKEDSHGLAAWASTRRALEQWFDDVKPEGWSRACFSLTPGAVAGRRRSWWARFEKPLSFALASCQYPPGPLDERPAMASYQALLALAESGHGPQFVVLTGDQVYVDATAGVFDPSAAPEQNDPREAAAQRVDLSGIYERAWRLPEVRQVMAVLPSLAMIDDHEIRNDYPGRRATGGDLVADVDLSAAVQHQVRLSGGLWLGSPRWRSYAWNSGGLPFFMLETRLSRDPRTPFNVATAAILPEEVLADLLRRLARLPAHLPKFILSSTPLLPPERFPLDAGLQAMRLRSDSWSGFPASASFLMTKILERRIQGVVLLAGDPHQSSVTSFCFDEAPELEVVSVVSSGLYTPWPFANQRPDEVILEGPVRIGGTGPAGRMHRHLHTSRAAFAVVDISPATQSQPAGLRVTLHPSDGESPRFAELQVGLPVCATQPSSHPGIIMSQPLDPLNHITLAAVATPVLEAAPAAAPPTTTTLKATSITLWMLTESADVPKEGRVGTATLLRSPDCTWRIDAGSFKTDPVKVSWPPAVARITLQQDAPLTLRGTQLEVALDVRVSITPVIGDDLSPSTVKLTLTNDADLHTAKPRAGEPPLPIDLKVKAYDPNTGEFAVAGRGKLKGDWADGPVALRIEGCFVPPL